MEEERDEVEMWKELEEKSIKQIVLRKLRGIRMTQEERIKEKERVRTRSLNRILNRQERIRYAKEKLQAEADESVEVKIKYQSKEYKVIETMAGIYWQIYKIHADAMVQ